MRLCSAVIQIVSTYTCIEGRTLRQDADRLAEVCRLTIRAPGILQHPYQVPEFTEETMLSLTVRRDVRSSKPTYWVRVV